MTYTEAALIVLATGCAAAWLALVVRRRVHIDALRRHHEIGSAVFLQMGVVFAVLLAFVFNQVWGEYNAADEAIARESADLRIAALIADNLPRAAQESTRAAITEYISDVIQYEWPDMEQRRRSQRAENSLRQLAFSVIRLPLDDPQEAQTRNEITILLRSAGQQRQVRLFQMTSGLPPALWFMLLTFSVTLTGFLFFFGIDNVVSQMTFTGVFAGGLAMLFTILEMLDYPFEGSMRLSPAAFQQTLDYLRGMM